MDTETITHKIFSPAQVNGFSEYLLVARPDASVDAQIMEEKQFFSAHFTAPAAANTKPHITIASFLAGEAMEETIIRWMHRIISSKKSFRVTLNQYGAYRPHTIYLRVQDHEPFQQLAKELKVVDQYIRGYGCPEMQLVTNPYLPIAGKLEQTTYSEAVKWYAEKTFHASFSVKELVLLRRINPFDNCKQVNVFGLLP